MGDDINNWGRWGPDDELGAANLITPEVTVGAAGLVRKGKVYSLASVIREAGAPRLEFRAANQHFVRVFAGPEEGAFVADDVVVLGCHGSSTHIDALCHYWADDKLYNGYPAASSRAAARASWVCRCCGPWWRGASCWTSPR